MFVNDYIHSQKNDAMRYAVMKLVQNPKLLYLDNEEKENEIRQLQTVILMEKTRNFRMLKRRLIKKDIMRVFFLVKRKVFRLLSMAIGRI